MPNISDSVKDYYGKTLQTSDDLQTNTCCTIDEPPKHIKEALANIHDEVITKYYGCGLTIPDAIDGLTILDLGSGSGRDVYIASQLVGEDGHVIGIDMTDEQLGVAERYIPYHMNQFGYQRPNVEFIKGDIANLDKLGITPGSIDIIISNCVINLVEDKAKALRDAYALLKPGGEMYFSDVYSDRRIPRALQEDQVLWGECLSGALYWNDFLKYAKRAGFTDPRSVKNSPITIDNDELMARVGDIQFYSVTYRLWKIDGLEDDCEDYGQAVAYRGTIPNVGPTFSLDDHHDFSVGKIMTVCGNTYKMLHDTRYRTHFDFYGTWDTHFGIFEGCGGAMPFGQTGSLENDSSGSCC